MFGPIEGESMSGNATQGTTMLIPEHLRSGAYAALYGGLSHISTYKSIFRNNTYTYKEAGPL
jgi:hypothetical protein